MGNPTSNSRNDFRHGSDMLQTCFRQGSDKRLFLGRREAFEANRFIERVGRPERSPLSSFGNLILVIFSACRAQNVADFATVVRFLAAVRSGDTHEARAK